MSFTAKRISLSFGDDALPVKLVYRSEDLEPMRNLAATIGRARQAASSLLKHARGTARSIKARAAAAQQAREEDAAVALITRARALEQSYRLAQTRLTDEMEATLDVVLAAALTRLGAAFEPDERLRIIRDELAKTAGQQPGARLHLCAADASTSCAAGLTFPWPTYVDDVLAPGHCRLVSDHGEWVLEFTALMTSFVGSSTD